MTPGGDPSSAPTLKVVYNSVPSLTSVSRRTRSVVTFPVAVLYHLDQLNVAAAMRARADARYVVMQNGSRVTL